jgi:hypothetical protein
MKPKILAFTALVVVLIISTPLQQARGAQPGVPHFEPDPYWPKPLPNNWMLAGLWNLRRLARPHLGDQPSANLG